MARALKTYQTSAGFFDLAIAAPSMKAALEAWGSRANLFHQGFARETHDAAIVAATMAKPGVVLRRPVGSKGAFREQADLPEDLPVSKPSAKPAPKPKKTARAPAPVDREEARKAAQSFERERQRRERARLDEEQARAREEAARDRAIARAESDLEKARTEHDRKSAALEQRMRAEDARWAKQRAGLEAALRRARRA